MTAAELREAKKKPDPGMVYQKFGAYREETQKIGVGDVIQATAGFKDYGGRGIDTGTVMAVTGFTEAGNIRVQTASGADRILRADAGHFRSAITQTSQASQGRTTDHVFLWLPTSTFPAIRTATAYVAGTRGRKAVTAFTDDIEGLREAVNRDDERQLASELVRLTSKGVRSRLKRYVHWLRAVTRPATRAPEPVHQLTQQHERSMSL